MTGSYTYTFEDIQNRPVAVIGAGTLGRRVALMFASRGGTVRIHARRAEQLAAATRYVTETLPKVVAARGSGEVGVATAAGSLEEALDDAWLAIESVPEKLEIKIPLWGQIDQAAPPDTIFATNSSSYPSRLMAENVRDKTRLCNIHFYMPPEINAVDLMSDGETDRACSTPCWPSSLSSASILSRRARSAPASFSIASGLPSSVSRWPWLPKAWPVPRTSTGCSRSTGACRPDRFR